MAKITFILAEVHETVADRLKARSIPVTQRNIDAVIGAMPMDSLKLVHSAEITGKHIDDAINSLVERGGLKIPKKPRKFPVHLFRK